MFCTGQELYRCGRWTDFWEVGEMYCCLAMSRFRVLEADSSLSDGSVDHFLFKVFEPIKDVICIFILFVPQQCLQRETETAADGNWFTFLFMFTHRGRCEETGLQCELRDKRKQQKLAWLSCALSCSVVTEAPLALLKEWHVYFHFSDENGNIAYARRWTHRGKLRPYILIPTYYLTQTSLDTKQYVWHVSVSRDDRKH